MNWFLNSVLDQNTFASRPVGTGILWWLSIKNSKKLGLIFLIFFFFFFFFLIIVHYKRIGYNINIMRQSARLVFNPVTVNNFAALFNCTPVSRASDTMMARHKAIYFSWLGPELFVCCLAHRGSTVFVFFLLFFFATVFHWCCLISQRSPGVGRNTLFLSSLNFCFIIVFIGDLFVSRDDPLMS